MFDNLRRYTKIVLSPHCKWKYIKKLPANPRILDIGCGNDSAYNAKSINPGICYIDVDVQEYNITNKCNMDEFHATESSDFAKYISNMDTDYDLVVSTHNIEHCTDPIGTLNAMCKRVKTGGRLYMS